MGKLGGEVAHRVKGGEEESRMSSNRGLEIPEKFVNRFFSQLAFS